MNKMVWCCLSLCGAGKNLGDGNLRGRLESMGINSRVVRIVYVVEWNFENSYLKKVDQITVLASEVFASFRLPSCSDLNCLSRPTLTCNSPHHLWIHFLPQRQLCRTLWPLGKRSYYCRSDLSSDGPQMDLYQALEEAKCMDETTFVKFNIFVRFCMHCVSVS